MNAFNDIIETNWSDIKEMIDKLWYGKFCRLYKKVKLDKDDFESMAGLEITLAINNWNKETSLIAYLRVVVQNRGYSLMTKQNRIKRKCDTYSDSLNQTISNGERHVELGDLIPYSCDVEENVNENFAKYLQKLSSFQKDILILKLLSLNVGDIANCMEISEQRVNDILKVLSLKWVERNEKDE